MASTSSVGTASLANASAAHAFYAHFSHAAAALRTRVADASDAEQLHEALHQLALLGAELTAAVDSGILPSHDQAVHKRTLEQLSRALDQRRRALDPKPHPGQAPRGRATGFAFRRKPPSQPKPAAQTPQPEAHPAQLAQLATGAGLQGVTASDEVRGERAEHVTISSLQSTSYVAALPSGADAPVRLSVQIAAITDSLIDLRPLGASGMHTVVSVQLRGVVDSIVLLPSVEGSVMAHDLTRGLVSIPSCHQFRMHTSSAVAVELATKRASTVTIEACRSIVFVARHPAELRVQDFDDLLSSTQLRPTHEPARTAHHFSIVKPEHSLAHSVDLSHQESKPTSVAIAHIRATLTQSSTSSNA